MWVLFENLEYFGGRRRDQSADRDGSSACAQGDGDVRFLAPKAEKWWEGLLEVWKASEPENNLLLQDARRAKAGQGKQIKQAPNAKKKKKPKKKDCFNEFLQPLQSMLSKYFLYAPALERSAVI